MIALVRKKTLHQPSNAALGCLCCSDLFIGLLSLLMVIPTFFWIFGSSSSDRFRAYQIFFAMRTFSACLSTMFIMLVNLDRYAAICYPFKYLEYATPKLYTVIVIFVCIFSILVCSVIIYIGQVSEQQSIYLIATIIVLVVAFVLAYCNLSIIRVTQRHSREIASSESHDDGQHRRYQCETNRYRIVALLVIVFMLCKLPSVIFSILTAVAKMKYTTPLYIFHLASSTIFLLDSLINPIAYYFRLKVFRDALKAVFCPQSLV